MAHGANDAARDATEAVARRSYGKLVALLAARSGDLAAAEDALADAFAAALAEWPRGRPSNPEAWLLTVARRRLIDAARRRRSGEAALEHWQRLADGIDAADDAAAIPDRRLALMFACAHPAIEAGIRAPLMLQAVLGLDARRIAGALLTSPAAMGKRLGRAKEKIRQAGIPLRVPEPEELASRLDGVLAAIYAAFTDGWAGLVDREGIGGDFAGRDFDRHGPTETVAGRGGLSGEALFLARLAAELLPREPEALGLLACLLHAHARRHARRDAGGGYVPLREQDVSRWDAAMIDEAETLLRRASAFGKLGRYQLEAALQSAHAERRVRGATNWAAVLQLYDALSALTGSPVVAVNRALALAELHGAATALAALPGPDADPRLRRYQPYWATRAELLARAGACGEARSAYGIAIGLESDPAVRRFLRGRQNALAQ
jgi:RNA polymerase sigma-70 factor (ECF subfamily)